MNTINWLNNISGSFVLFSLVMLLQVSVLIAFLLVLDFILRQKVQAVFRYCLWMLVLVKLVLPVGLALPCSPAYYLSCVIGDFKGGNSSQSFIFTSGIDAVTAENVSSQAISDGNLLAGGQDAVNQPLPVSISWQAYISLMWFIAVLIMLGLLIQRAFFVSSVIKQAGYADEKLMAQLKKCAVKIGVRSRVSLKVSANAASPAVCGLIRPVVLIPQNILDNIDSAQIDSILMHELAHIKRGDLWVNLAQSLLQIFYFYNPVLWIANAIIRKVREQAVDETVLAAMDEQACDYPESLLNISKLVWSKPMLSLRMIGVVESKSAMVSRLRHILSRPFPKSAKLGCSGVTVILIIAAIILPMAKADMSSNSSDIQDQQAGSKKILSPENDELISKSIENPVQDQQQSQAITVPNEKNLKKSIIAYWPFDGNAKDKIGRNHGTVYGAALADGVSDKAYYFEGDGDCISIPASKVFEFSEKDFAISAWFKMSVNKSPFPFIINFRQNDNNPHIEIYASKDLGTHILPADARITYSDAGINDNRWHHVAITMKNGKEDGYKIYLDGLLAGKGTYNGRLKGWDSITIGAQKVGGGKQYAFDGFIDEVAIYNRALTDKEITGIYKAFSKGSYNSKIASNSRETEKTK